MPETLPLPSLKQLAYLVALDDLRHFRRAAERCGVTQPTLSAQLRELEGRLGARLVERNRGEVLLTRTGTEVAARARRVLREVGELVDTARRGATILGGTIRLGVLPTLGPYLLPLILPSLHEAHPTLRLSLRERMPDALLAELEDGRLDAMLVALPAGGADLETARLFWEPLLAVMPIDHPAAQRPSLQASDLRGADVLALEPGHRLREQVAQICREVGARMPPDFEGTSLDTLRQMVVMGAGISFLPALYIRSETRREDAIAVVPLAPRPPRRLIGLVWRRGSSHAHEFEALAALIRRVLKETVPEVIVVG